MDIESDISRAAALIAQGLSLVERIEFADAVRGVSTLEEIPQKYREQISVLIKKKEARHLPGQHDQLTHGSGGRSNYKAGAWRKGNNLDKKTLLETRYGEMADNAIAKGTTNLSRDEIIAEAARVDENNINNKNSELWINGSNHTISFVGSTKKMSDEDKKALFKDVDNLQEKYPLEQLDVEVVSDWRGTKGVEASTWGYTSDDGKKIALKSNKISEDSRFNNENWKKMGITTTQSSPNYMEAIDTSSTAEYIIAHEWGHALESQNFRIKTSGMPQDRLYNQKVLFGLNLNTAIQKGEKDGGFMSKYGKKNEFESYAEGFADFYLSKGNSKNPVTQSLAKEFKWK